MRRNRREKRQFELSLEQEFPFMRQKEISDDQWEKGSYSLYDAYGCAVGEGWYSILRGLCLDVTKAYKAVDKPIDLVISQVKEKFGSLRFYYHPVGHDPGIHAFDFLGSGTLRISPGKTDLHSKISEIVSKWEDLSGSTCESCGASGELRKDLGWVKTYCDSCYAEVISKKEGEKQK